MFFFLLSELCWALLICFELIGIDQRKEFVNFQKAFPRPCAVLICFDVIGPASANKYTPNLSLCLLIVWFLLLPDFIRHGLVAIHFEKLLSFSLAVLLHLL